MLINSLPIFVTILSIIVSGLYTFSNEFFLSEDVEGKSYFDSYKFVNESWKILIIFAAAYVILISLVIGVYSLIKWRKGNKRCIKDRVFLTEMIYKKCINDLVTAQSLVKKSETVDENKKLFIYEALYHIKEIQKAFIYINLETPHEKNKNYQLFLEEVSPFLLIEILSSSIKLLDNISTSTDISENDKCTITDMKGSFDTCRNSLKTMQGILK